MGFVDLEKYLHSTQREDGDGDAAVDGSTWSGSEDGWGQVREDTSKRGGGRRSIRGVWGQDSKSDEGWQEKNGGVKGRDGSAEELDRETGEEQITVGRTRWKDGGWQTTEESGRVMWTGHAEAREANAEMGGQC